MCVLCARFGCCAGLDCSKSDVTCECKRERDKKQQKIKRVIVFIICFFVFLSRFFFFLFGSLHWTVCSFGRSVVSPFCCCRSPHTLSHLHRHNHHKTIHMNIGNCNLFFFCVSSTSKCNHCSVCNTLFCLKRKTSFLFVYSLAGV